MIKRIGLTALALWMLVGITACFKSPEEKFKGYMDDYFELVLSSEDDCETLAKKIDRFTNKNGDKIAECLTKMFEKAEETQDDTAVKQMLTDVVPKDKEKLVSASRCASTPSFIEANKKFGGIIMTTTSDYLVKKMQKAMSGVAK
jgi:hypothetical protein